MNRLLLLLAAMVALPIAALPLLEALARLADELALIVLVGCCLWFFLSRPFSGRI